MTAVREAIVLPSLFLTVAAAGGLRFGASMVAPPSLYSLVLAVLLAGALVQSGALDPLRLMNSSRSTLANGNGVVLLGTLVLASAQVFSLLTPESGLPRVIFSLYFLVMMFHTTAAGPDRVHLMRSLAVMFGAAFVFKFIVLDALADPASGRAGRALQLLFEGVTLGTLTQDVQHPAAGYVAFLTVGMFLVSVWMLPEHTGSSAYSIAVGHGDPERRRLTSSSTELPDPQTRQRVAHRPMDPM
jgi:hypothetical protein